MKFVQIYSDRRWLERFVPAGTMTTGELVDKLKDLPRDLPIVFCTGEYYWGFHITPVVTQKNF